MTNANFDSNLVQSSLNGKNIFLTWSSIMTAISYRDETIVYSEYTANPQFLTSAIAANLWPNCFGVSISVGDITVPGFS